MPLGPPWLVQSHWVHHGWFNAIGFKHKGQIQCHLFKEIDSGKIEESVVILAVPHFILAHPTVKNLPKNFLGMHFMI